MYSAASSVSSIVAAGPRFSRIGLLIRPSSRSRLKFCIFRAPICRISTYLMKSGIDRKSTRLNSSHLGISYAVFCLKKKKLLRQKAPDHFQMIFNKGENLVFSGEPSGGMVPTKDPWFDLPGLSVLIGGMWIAKLRY